jgi:hypothetical protein
MTDVRVNITTKIWGLATVMLAICIPLSAVTNTGAILPLAVIAGATVSTVSVWRSHQQTSQNSIMLEPAKLRALEERIANLETIVSSPELDLPPKIKRLEVSDGA